MSSPALSAPSSLEAWAPSRRRRSGRMPTVGPPGSASPRGCWPGTSSSSWPAGCPSCRRYRKERDAVKVRWLALGLGAAAGAAALLERRIVRRERAKAGSGEEADFEPPVTERTIGTDDGGEIHVLERGEGPPIVTEC